MRGATVGDQVRPQSELISIHAPLAGCDIDDLIPYANNAKFQSTHPSRGATRAIWIPHSWRKYFNPRAPCGARRCSGRPCCNLYGYFNPRAPCGARPARNKVGLLTCTFQSTRPVRGATLPVMHGVWDLRISIHAPRAGRDSGLSVNIHKVSNFNPRAPCGARPSKSTKAITASTFQSTRPVRGATLKPITANMIVEFQSTRPVRGATEPLRFSVT